MIDFLLGMLAGMAFLIGLSAFFAVFIAIVLALGFTHDCLRGWIRRRFKLNCADANAAVIMLEIVVAAMLIGVIINVGQ